MHNASGCFLTQWLQLLRLQQHGLPNAYLRFLLTDLFVAWLSFTLLAMLRFVHSSGSAASRALFVSVADTLRCGSCLTAQTKDAARESAATVKAQAGQNPLEALKNKIDEASITGNSPQKQLDQVHFSVFSFCCYLLFSLVS